MTASPSPSLAQSLHFWARNAANESALLRASLRLGLFDALPVQGSSTPCSLEALATATETSARGLRALLELLVCLGYVSQRDDDDARRFALTQGAAAFLRDSAFLQRLEAEQDWGGPVALLDEAVKHGEPVQHAGKRWDVLGHLRALFLEAAAPASSTEAEDFFDRFARSGARTQVLITSGRLGLLELLASAPRTLPELGAATYLSTGGLRVVVEVLEKLGLATREGEAFGLSAEARRLLDGKALAYMVRSLSVSAQYTEALERLDETVREERFILDLKDPEVSRRFYADNSNQITAVFASHFQLSRKAATTLSKAHPLEGASVLDIGTGSGVWGAAFARATPTTHVTYFDQAVVLEQVRANLERLQVADRARFWPGDLFTHDFGEAAFDVIILPQVLNVLRPESLPGLFARVARALKPDGVLLIAEYVLNERRDGPLDHLYFGLRRFMTNEGDLLSASEYARLLEAVGLSSSVCIPLPTQEMIFAARPGVNLPTRLAD
ncbi:methyltransferase domain-containing protein [Myxococcus sp. CA051A]|uniref:class I SAM-dependent methyltransferase n=1 Tax=unclassified Myxococcus TaxID=2648731 RepID=UPI00157A45C9|nr:MULTISPECIES: class I SAM-dependent methyltransferase [unclassified Myxococcus]NTX15078.1 methyltransferase domain-containing protein [Myxococcus sp. CA056]NTX63809.1 methyltransferase domain-containing protein [Myxococcus sp. CA051A]